MALRIDTSNDNGSTTVKVEGQLCGDEVAEFRRVCSAVTGVLVIDISQVQLADADGVDSLKQLRDRGAKLIAARPYLAMLLEES